jgi:hypothetical protein
MFGWTAGNGEHPCDQCKPGRSAYGLCKATIIGDALFGKFVERRGVSEGISVTSKERIIILAHEPEDVGPRWSRINAGC